MLGKMDVFHSLDPIRAVTRTDPKPRRRGTDSLMWSATSTGSVTNTHAASAAASYSPFSNEKEVFTKMHGSCHAVAGPVGVYRVTSLPDD